MTRDPIPFERALSSWRIVLLWIFAYCLFHAVFRMGLSPVVSVDDVEQVVAAQRLSLTYGSARPPLYTWMLWWLSERLGAGLLPLTVLKYGLLAVTLVAVYGAGRILLERPAHAGLAMIGLGFLYLVGWQVHRGYTHTVAVLAASAVTLWIVAALGRRPSLWLYAALGVALTLGLLAQYNFALLPLALGAAMAVTPGWRRVLLDWRMLPALAIPAVVLGAYFTAVLAAPEGPPWPSIDPAAVAQWSFLAARLAAVWAILAGALLQYLLPLGAAALICFPRLLMPGTWRAAWAEPDARLLLAHTAIGLGGLGVIGLALPLPFLDGHHLHPILMFAPIAVFAVYEAAVRSGIPSPFTAWRPGAAGFLGLFGACWLAVVGGLYVHATQQPPDCGNCRLQQPLVALADALAQAGITSGTIIAGDEFIAGNLAGAMPAMRVHAAPYAGLVPARAEREPLRCVVIWRAAGGPGEMARLEAATLRIWGRPLPHDVSPRTFNLRMMNLDEHRVRYNYLVLPPEGDCV